MIEIILWDEAFNYDLLKKGCKNINIKDAPSANKNDN